jgi:fructokinase
VSPPLIVGIGEILWDLLPAGRQLGGAPANFAYHANALGAHGAVVSRVGDDDLGREILQRLDALGVDRTHVSTDPDYPTGTVDVRLDPAGVPTYVIHEPVAWDFLPNDAPLQGLASRAAAVCFGSLAQRSPASRQSIRQFLRATPPTCLRVFDINLRQQYYSREVLEDSLRACDVLKLNDAELPVVSRVLHVPGEAFQGPAVSVARALLDRYLLRLVAVTRGPNGSLLLVRGGQTSDHPGSPVTNLADTVGAGDAFTAALVMGLLAHRDLDAINAAANRLAAYVCTQPGATPPIPAALAAEVVG